LSGNLSVRASDKIFITNSGTCLGHLKLEDISIIDMDGNLIEQKEKQVSSEKIMHINIYKKRADVNAVIHTHPPYSTAIAVSGESLNLPILAEPMVLLGEIPLIDYAMPSSDELANKVSEGFADSDAVLMANHGVTVCGQDIRDAFYKLETLEFYSEVYLLSGIIGKRKELNGKNIQDLRNLRKKMLARV